MTSYELREVGIFFVGFFIGLTFSWIILYRISYHAGYLKALDDTKEVFLSMPKRYESKSTTVHNKQT